MRDFIETLLDTPEKRVKAGFILAITIFMILVFAVFFTIFSFAKGLERVILFPIIVGLFWADAWLLNGVLPWETKDD